MDLRSSRTVLVVDDDRQIRESLSDALQDEGYLVLQARNGADAMAQLRARSDELPRVILLDLMMPVMDGFQFREVQLQDEALSKIPVVVLSAVAHLSTSAAKLQAASVLKKPFHLDQVLETIERYCVAPG